MNDQLQKQLADMLASLTQVTKDGAGWVGNQIPPLVHEKILFGRVNEPAQLILVVVFFYVMFRCAKACYKKIREDESYNDPTGWILGMAGSIGGMLILSIGFCFQLETTLMVWFAPRLYIVEWLKSMVTK